MGEDALPSSSEHTPDTESDSCHRPLSRIDRALVPVVVPSPNLILLLFLPTSCSPSRSPGPCPTPLPSSTLAIRIVVPLIKRTPDISYIPDLDLWAESPEIKRSHSDRSDKARAGGCGELAVKELEEVGGEGVGVGEWGGWGICGVGEE